ncbi:hypothetical protein [Nitrospirillum iridis]|uniref:Uncharacterized protein n=1 Tax=Nitrospirillum iridis TaxID=765888 RepID=A0A7X0AW76_9PROT|nr:hypothetical protein [Nitrospirillum iridis]MBB6251254.1 hypothetical protein [Nitrospirillum iridis]
MPQDEDAPQTAPRDKRQSDQRATADSKRDVGDASDTQRLKDEWAMTGHAATRKPGGPEHAPPPQQGGARPAPGSKGDWDASGSGQRGPQGDRSESTAGTGARANSNRGRGSTS